MRTVRRLTRFTARGVAAGLILTAVVSSRALAQASVSGVVYAAYTYNTASDTLKADSNLGHVNAFNVTRAYLNVNARFAGGIATRVTADIYNAGVGGGAYTYRLKYAYVNWTPDGSALTYRFGQLHTPFLDWEEALWDYRMQGAMAVDRNGYMSSSDFGAAVEGSINHDAVNFLGGVYNGQNYSGVRTDGGKDLMGRVTVRLLATDDPSRVGGLRLTGYAQYGTPLSGGQRQRYVGMVSYRSSNLTLAAEYVATTDSTTGGNTAIGGGATGFKNKVSGRIISVFGVAHLPETRWAAIGRIDVLDPNTADSSATFPTANKDQQTRIIAGVSYQLAPNVRLLGDYDAVSYQSGFTPTAATYAAYVSRSTANLHVQFTF